MMPAAKDEPRKKLYKEYVLKSELLNIKYAHEMRLLEMPEVVRLLMKDIQTAYDCVPKNSSIPDK